MTMDRNPLGRRLLSRFFVLLILSSGLLLGCGRGGPHSGKPTAPVTVTVTYGGEPVTEGRVDLSNEQTGEGGGGELNGQGVATIPGVVLGNYAVIVIPPEPQLVPAETGAPAPAKKEHPNIPAKFRSLNSSPLKVEVKKDSPNQFKFELKVG